MADGGRFCSACGAPLDPSEDVTRTSDPEARRAATPAPRTPPGGWLTSSAPISHGRFQPGAVFDGRYRIIALIGRGGMGEVYRADDLRLGQPVALKFLPEQLNRDPSRLAQLHNEVRIARQVSHPNVCRVYDIGESEGQLYLSMELVDGQDLAALLRRIGRLPEDKALDIARQMCAGLSAAHERGVQHRDLKPANVMLDDAGKVRIMDFGLAAVGDVTKVRAGTPVYMAPEQLAGREVTRQSDIYALGLVLYELFTGRRVFDAANLPDLMLQHAGPIAAPGQIIGGLDPRIERVILRCLEESPAMRPASALAVAAALPGDPLAEALAAGETPSPEMVAAAGSVGATLAPAEGLAWMAGLVVLLAAVGWLADRSTVVGQTRVVKPAAVLADYAARTRAAAGSNDPAPFEASGFEYDRDALAWYAAHGGPEERWARLQRAAPAAVRFWYRSSDRRLEPMRPFAAITREDPPAGQAGDTSIELDTEGRLLRFSMRPRLPPDAGAAFAPADWAPLLSAAGLDATALSPVAPAELPPSYADAVTAWEGPAPGSRDLRVRVLAASAKGRPVYFDVAGPWAARPPAPPQADRLTFAVSLASLVIQAGLVLLVLRLAFVNLRAGRADRRAAWRVALAGFVVEAGVWLLLPAHSTDPAREMARFFDGLAWALLYGATFGAAYLGLEPFVRRSWPRVLVGWTRLIGGRWRDPLVGHDMLIGLVLGFVASAATYGYQELPRLLGWPSPPGSLAVLSPLDGPAAAASAQLVQVNLALVNGLFLAFVVTALRRRIGSLWLILPLVALAFGLTYEPASTIEPAHAALVAFTALPVLIAMIILLRYGLLAWVAAALSGNLTSGLAFTLDPARAYFAASLMPVGVILVLGFAGWRLARGQAPIAAQPRS